MRIAIFTEVFLPKWDGVVNTLCHLLEHLAERGHQSMLFAPHGAPVHYAGTPIVGLRGMPFPFYPEIRLVPPLVNVRQQLQDFRPDLVQLINPVSLGLAGLREARRLGVPVAASYQTDIPGYAELYGLGVLKDPIWSYFRWIHNQADLNLCPSSFTMRELESQDFRQVAVWGHGVDTGQFSPAHRCPEWRARLTEGEVDAPLLLFVGRLALEKRVDWLRPVLDALPQARLAIVGDGPVRGRLETLFAGARTVFTGYLRGMDLARAYASADLFVFPSANETLGNVVLEAMASGIPVVAPRSGGVIDHVHEGINGHLFESDEMADLVTLVGSLLENKQELSRLGKTGREYAVQQSWEAVLDRLLDRYHVLIGKRIKPQPFPFLTGGRSSDGRPAVYPN